MDVSTPEQGEVTLLPAAIIERSVQPVQSLKRDITDRWVQKVTPTAEDRIQWHSF